VLQHATWTLVGNGSLVEHYATVDQDMGDAHWPLRSFAEVGSVNNLLRIKKHEVGGQPGGNTTSVVDAESSCRLVRHFAHSVCELEYASVAHVAPEHARECSEIARMWTRAWLVERDRVAVRANDGQRMLQESRDICFGSVKEHHLNLVSIFIT
jgi:hypothetical protein